MMFERNKYLLALLLAAQTVTAAAQNENAVAVAADSAAVQLTAKKDSAAKILADNKIAQLTFAQKVYDTRAFTKNITGRLTLGIKAGGKDISLPASLHMRKDELIRLQILAPLIGSELARIDFAPGYVLIVDRIHKEYIKADYNKIDFLKKQGLSFYSLQAMFWNQLLLPGTKTVGDADLKKFTVDLGAKGATLPLTIKSGGITYRWNADRKNAQIKSALVTYVSKEYGHSSFTWQYDNFKAVGAKLFPATQHFTIVTYVNKKKQQAEVNIDMNDVDTDDKWSTTTELSKRYNNVAPEDAFSKLLNF